MTLELVLISDMGFGHKASNIGENVPRMLVNCMLVKTPGVHVELRSSDGTTMPWLAPLRCLSPRVGHHIMIWTRGVTSRRGLLQTAEFGLGNILVAAQHTEGAENLSATLRDPLVPLASDELPPFPLFINSKTLFNTH